MRGPSLSLRAVLRRTAVVLSAAGLLLGAAGHVPPLAPASSMPSPLAQASVPADLEAGYLVLAWDAPDVGPRLLEMAQQHWNYTDLFSRELIFRGPMLSDDGRRHAGSLHLLRTADADLAQRFARDEPYHRAGLFARVEVLRFTPLLPPTRTAQALPDAPAPHAFVRVAWRPTPCPTVLATAQRGVDPAQWLLLGLLQDDAGLCTGMAGVLNGGFAKAQADVETWLQTQGLPLGPIQVARWRRGGRP